MTSTPSLEEDHPSVLETPWVALPQLPTRILSFYWMKITTDVEMPFKDEAELATSLVILPLTYSLPWLDVRVSPLRN